MRTIRATAPLRWAPFYLSSDPSCFRMSRERNGALRSSAVRDREDATRFLAWVNAGLPVRVQLPECKAPGDYCEYAGCKWSNEALGEYVFLIPHKAKAYSPAVAGIQGGTRMFVTNFTAAGLGTILHACQR